MMYLVYLLEFNESEKVFIGLTDNLNWQMDFETTFFKTQYHLDISSIKILSFTKNKKNAQIDYEVWMTKTKKHNLNSQFTDEIPDSFISQSLKDKKTIIGELKKLEEKYIGLYYEYKSLKENSLHLNDIVDQVISENIAKWKDSELNTLYYDDEGYDHNGFDRYGYNREGYNRQGIDQFGYDITGLDADGYDVNGFDIYGYDKEGFDYDGLDKDGYDRNHYEQIKKKMEKKKGKVFYDDHGFDINGFDRFGRHRDELQKSKTKKYDEDGFDQDGYDKKGFDIRGVNRKGYDKFGNYWSQYDRVKK